MGADQVDVLIVGAGISGLCAAQYLRTVCPERSFTIVEARARLGGTWDLFRYPGIRSDSDMYTLGYSFRPWTGAQAMADGPSIRTYLEDTARDTGIAEHIRFGLRLEAASWSSVQARWSVTVRDVATGVAATLTCRFLWACTGYYRYDEGYTPDFAGLADYRGRVVHPQHWPEDLDVAGQRVVIVGSGATAVTLAPELARAGARVTVLQRTPTYMVSRPTEEVLARRLRPWLPDRWIHRLLRWKNIGLATAFYAYCQQFPQAARRLLKRRVAAAIGDAADIDRDFDPPYDPWDQRLCLVADNDLFDEMVAGRVSLVTDHVDRFTASGIALASGRTLDADLVVTATGLRLQFFGGAAIEVDGAPVDLAQTRMYKGAMLSDVPNAAFVLGYTNASWTLKCELVCAYVARVLRHMADHGQAVCVPRKRDPSVGDAPALNLTSGYVRRAHDALPSQGTKDPWRLHQSYLRDRSMYRRPIEDGILELREG